MNKETETTKTPHELMCIAIGQKVAELLYLKFGKDGRTKTSWGTKSIQGLGVSIERIVEEEINYTRLNNVKS